MKFGSVNEIIEFAIKKEEEAYQFYNDLSNSVSNPNMRQVFMDFAAQEHGHKVKLLNVKAGKITIGTEQKVKDLKIGDHLVDIEMTPNLDYQQALIIAMKAEKAAYKLYLDLAAATDDANLKATFSSLAQEEANHKLRFEIEYDDRFFSEN